MTFDVDELSIEHGIRANLERSYDAASLWVALEGVERSASFDAIKTAFTRARSDGSWRVGALNGPTDQGVLVSIEPSRLWRAGTTALTERLEEMGFTGRVSGPPRSVVGRIDGPPGPAAMIRVHTSRSLAAGQRPGWSVSESDLSYVLDLSAAWVAEAGVHGEINGGGPHLPASADDAADLVRARLVDGGQMDVALTFTRDAADLGRWTRRVQYESLGQLVYGEITADVAVEQQVDQLLDIFFDLAPVIDGGMIRPMPFDDLRWSSLGWWVKATHLWASYVPDVAPLQVLNSHQIERANDLSRWEISELAPDRFLVRAHDLSPWFQPVGEVEERPGVAWGLDDVVDADTLDRAREDFGDLVLDLRVLVEHPPP